MAVSADFICPECGEIYDQEECENCGYVSDDWMKQHTKKKVKDEGEVPFDGR